MKVFVNDKPVEILPGMPVRHALISADLLRETESLKQVFDEWDHEIGLDGALAEGSRIYLK